MEIKKENSLAYKYPLIALQWHPTKNEKLSPSDVTGSSGKKGEYPKVCVNLQTDVR